ncbi:hypothetical protein JTE88_06575 [Arcanobacterium phocisimile]|uniref:Lycopene cyclase domain-containing protein n=1 Tax=Arcanobacterium phocisimile TaxID=1302235 RepID=A0ABX7IFK6_9ACTO|nr:hypothetical protein [Arcanobacterium phocisimile]QRV01756.1 hypothetical protein JTE88_06575 [Arcanobacterium phocisimile]
MDITRFWYLGSILVSFAGLGFLDWRHGITAGTQRSKVLLAILSATAWLLFWDVAGIWFGIFFKGSGPWQIGLFIAPEIPVEELVFLLFLNYLTLLVFLVARKYRERLPLAKISGTIVVVLILNLVLSSQPRLYLEAYTYMLVNLVFLLPLFFWFYRVNRQNRLPVDSILFTLAIVSLLTAVFDPLLIYNQIVGYHWSRTSGLLLWLAPLEDFAYPLAGTILISLILDHKEWRHEITS